MLHRISRAIEVILIFFIFAALFSYSSPPLTDEIEKTRAFTRDIEFNYITWTLNALAVKIKAQSVSAPQVFDRVTQKELVMEYLRNIQNILDREHELKKIFADPNIADKQSASQTLRNELDDLYSRQNQIAPLAESVLQQQVSQILAEIGLTTAGQPVPNVFYHSTPLPFALIISPRDRIEQIVNISLETSLTIDEQDALENQIDSNLDKSALVVPIGGVGVYPTMVYRTSDLPWLLSTIAHEWIHNYLTFRPLGFLYTTTPEIRTMNETTASIAGDEIGALVLERYYPELVTASPPTLSLISNPFDHPQPGDFLRPPFDFRAEMHETRVQADELLAAGKIEEAEAYMESRRQIFWNQGYLIRKLNQAYFAFYGAYADTPGGAAGQDPVGPAVRKLREQSDSLADFINTIAWMTNFEQLQQAVGP